MLLDPSSMFLFSLRQSHNDIPGLDASVSLNAGSRGRGEDATPSLGDAHQFLASKFQSSRD